MFKPSNGICLVQSSINKLFVNKEPWQIVVITTTSVLSAVWLYEFLNKDECLWKRTKKHVFRMARKYVPMVRDKVNAELEKVNKDFETDIMKHGNIVGYITELPADGMKNVDILKKVDDYLALGN